MTETIKYSDLTREGKIGANYQLNVNLKSELEVKKDNQLVGIIRQGYPVTWREEHKDNTCELEWL